MYIYIYIYTYIYIYIYRERERDRYTRVYILRPSLRFGASACRARAGACLVGCCRGARVEVCIRRPFRATYTKLTHAHTYCCESSTSVMLWNATSELCTLRASVSSARTNMCIYIYMYIHTYACIYTHYTFIGIYCVYIYI